MTIVLAGATWVATSSAPAGATTPGTLSVLAGQVGTSGPPSGLPAAGTSTTMATPFATATLPDGDVVVVDEGAAQVFQIAPDGVLSLLAGTGADGCGTVPLPGTTPEAATGVALCEPYGIATDEQGDVYVSSDDQGTVYKISPQGTLSLLVPVSTLGYPAGVATDAAGNVYVVDAYGNEEVYKITPSGSASVYAGGGATPPTLGGVPATSAQLSDPFDVATDSAGNVYITAGTGASGVVDKVSTSGVLSIVAGSVGGSTPATTTALHNPSGVVLDSLGDIFVAEDGTCVVDKITPQGGTSVVAGDGCGTPNPGAASTSSPLYGPEGLTLNQSGDLVVADTNFSSGALVEDIAQLAPPPAPLPGTPTLGSDGAITFPWSAVAGATSYVVTPYVNGVPQAPVTVDAPATSYSLSGPQTGATYTFTVAATSSAGTGAASAQSVGVSVPSAGGAGYWLVGGDGGVFSYGMPFYGSTGSMTLNKPVVGMTGTSDNGGYWFVAADGGVFSYGDAAFEGSLPVLGTKVSDIVAAAADPTTHGYWLVGADGGVFAFGAPFEGSLPSIDIKASDIVGLASTPTGRGYYLVSATGAVYAFGDASYQGSANTVAPKAPIVGMTVDEKTGGYWEVDADGGTYAYGAPFEGSLPLLGIHVSDIVGIAAAPDGAGYWEAAADGGVFAFGSAGFQGSMGGQRLHAPIVGATG